MWQECVSDRDEEPSWPWRRRRARPNQVLFAEPPRSFPTHAVGADAGPRPRVGPWYPAVRQETALPRRQDKATRDGLDIQRTPSAPRTRPRRVTGDGPGADDARVAPAWPSRRKRPHVHQLTHRKLQVPPCPRRASGHAWRLARERSTPECEGDECYACGLLRMTSYRTGQVVGYRRSGDSVRTEPRPRRQEDVVRQPARSGRERAAVGCPDHKVTARSVSQ